jgi:HD-GYP domain-containing protein (c-di-GMP phosphodiesterase class II)
VALAFADFADLKSTYSAGHSRRVGELAERIALRLHPYHAERILARVPALESAAPLVAAHHERMDDKGYYRGMAGEHIPLGARIIAVADAFDELAHDSPDHVALDPELALERMHDQTDWSLWREAVEALARELGAGAVARHAPKTSQLPAGLTSREVEVLQLLARGMSRREVAQALVVSEHTVRHHLEHIYTKIGVGTRVAATLFAVEHSLLR